jgi:hypothetical protein
MQPTAQAVGDKQENEQAPKGAKEGKGRRRVSVLKQPDKFLPVTADPSFQALVSSGLNGDFCVRDVATGELYLNFFAMGQSFFRVAEQDVLNAPSRLEPVEDKTLAKKLIRTKYAYIDLYLES